MSVPVKTGGGKSKRAARAEPEGEIRPSRGQFPPASVGREGRSLPKPPQGHAGFERPLGPYRPPRRDGTAPRYTNRSVKAQMLAVAIEAATERGYESMRISEITEPVGVTRQAFYAHFRDKRHCLCEAISPKLASIERLAASASEQEAVWATQIIGSVDEVLFERFQSSDGTKGRLITAMRSLLDEKGSLAAIKIGQIVKTAHVPQGDFYKTFSGKKECFACAYEQLLGETFAAVEARLGPAAGGSAEPRHEFPVLLRALGEELISDPDRLSVLVVEAAQLPERDDETTPGAWRGSLGQRIAALLAAGPSTSSVDFLAGSVVEVIRSAVAAGEPDRIPDRLVSLGGMGAAASASGPDGVGAPLAA